MTEVEKLRVALEKIVAFPSSGTNDRGQVYDASWAMFQVHEIAQKALREVDQEARPMGSGLKSPKTSKKVGS